MEQTNKSKTLIRVIICFGALAFIFAVCLIVSGVLIVQSATNPAHIKSVATAHITIADPLPEGYTYTAAYEVSGIPILQIGEEGEPSLYTFTFADDPAKKQSKSNADLADDDRATEQKRSLAVALEGRLTPKITDQLNFANETMYYAIGRTELSGLNSTVNNGFCGVAQSSKTGRFLMLWVEKQSLLPKDGNAIDLMRIKKLLSSIKSF